MVAVLDTVELEQCRDARLPAIWAKVQAGERLGREDGVALFETEDLLTLGRMANAVKERLSGDDVYFVVNRQLNPTNKCALSCKFCDYAKTNADKDGYEMTREEILAHCGPDVSEVHIVSGLHPKWKYEQYVDIVRAIRAHNPTIQIKAWTAVEIDFFARLARKSTRTVLEEMREVGMQTMPGGGCEIFSKRVKKALFNAKIGEKPWLQVHREAHELGIKTNCTMLYGHIETYAERVDHILKLRDLEDEAPGFLAFIPLAYQIGYTKLVDRQASAIEDLKTVAVSRLLFDNIPHVKAYWVMLGEATATIALNFGASDMDGTIGRERIAHAALADSPDGLEREHMTRLIRDARRRPVERDALYNIVRTYERTDPRGRRR